VRSSDDWEFPTNQFPNIGWLGRVHRGTPWQTIYLKATDVLDDGRGWRLDELEREYEPVRRDQFGAVSDRILFDVFTTAPNENATRGQLSINQSTWRRGQPC